jgi:hypothetical protein
MPALAVSMRIVHPRTMTKNNRRHAADKPQQPPCYLPVFSGLTFSTGVIPFKSVHSVPTPE